MTKAQVTFQKGSAFDSVSATHYRPGRDIQIDELRLTNNQQRMREEDQPEPVESVEGNFEGRLSLSWTMSSDTHDDVRDIIFNDGGTGFTDGEPAYSRWFVGTDYLDTSFGSNTVELELRSCIPLSYTITYEQETNTVREQATFGFADLRKNTAFTASSITGPTAGSDAEFHGVSLTVNSSTVNRNQATTVEFPEPLARYHREEDRNPVAAVEAGPEPTLSSTVIYHTDDYLGLALSGDTAGSTQPQEQLGNTSGNIAFSAGGATINTYTFAGLSLEEWQGQDLANRDADFSGQALWHANDGISIS